MAPPDNTVRCKWPQCAAFVLAIILACIAVGRLWEREAQSVGVDFLHYTAVRESGRILTVGNIYSDEGRENIGKAMAIKVLSGKTTEKERVAIRSTLELDRGAVETIATPFLFAIFNMRLGDSYDREFACHRMISIACLVFSVMTLAQLFGLSRTVGLLVVAALAVWFEPLHSDLRVGNINCIQLALVTASLALLNRPKHSIRVASAGFLMAMCVMLKPNAWIMLLLVLLFFLIARKQLSLFAMLGGTLGGVLVAAIASMIYFGHPNCWIQWFGILPDVMNSHRELGDGNVGLVQLAAHLAGVNLSVFFTIALLVAITALGWFGWKRLAAEDEEHVRRDDLFLAVAAGGGLMVLCSRLVWPHYYVLTVPLMLFALRGISIRRDNVVVTVLAALAFMCLTVAASSMPGLRPAGHAGFLNAGTVLALAVCVMARLRSYDRESGRELTSSDRCSGDNSRPSR